MVSNRVSSVSRVAWAWRWCARFTPRLRCSSPPPSITPASPAQGQDAGKLAGLEPVGVVVVGGLLRHRVEVAGRGHRFLARRCRRRDCRGLRSRRRGADDRHDRAATRRRSRASTRPPRQIPVLVSANTSVALNVLAELVRLAAAVAAARLRHRDLRGPPSAQGRCAFGHGAAAGRCRRRRARPAPGPARVPHRRPGRRRGEQGASASPWCAGGDVVGEHDVRFLGAGEQLRLSHVATDRAIFARGALAAAAWLVGRPAGRYTMADFLFSKQ